MPRFSLIIPVYNRPQEIKELLESLTLQTVKDFEVIVVEDGSTLDCKAEIQPFFDQLELRYFFKENTGQGFSRNFGFEHAKGDYLIVFDSDCIIPPIYLENVEKGIKRDNLDAFGGPDKAHESFTDVQKAISYAMTSVLTTGGIRGQKKRIGAFHPRSFNMGISRKVYEKVGGYIITRMGEDLEYSIRIINAGFKVGLIDDAFVYHKRRTSFKQFYKQLHFFGRARVNIYRFFPSELKLVHFFPAAFTIFEFSVLLSLFLPLTIFPLSGGLLFLYLVAVFINAYLNMHSLKLACLGTAAAVTMLTGYGVGFLTELWREIKNRIRG